ncbi:MAG: hypothetical protein AAB573_05415 [Patescibacteria group bacterium]
MAKNNKGGLLNEEEDATSPDLLDAALDETEESEEDEWKDGPEKGDKWSDEEEY